MVVPTVPIAGLGVKFSAVNPEIQAFISDIMYRTYYSKSSELRNMIHGTSGLSQSAVLDIITSVFNSSVPDILVHYPNLTSATLTIKDAYIKSGTLKIDSTILVNTITPQIYEEVSVEVRF